MSISLKKGAFFILFSLILTTATAHSADLTSSSFFSAKPIDDKVILNVPFTSQAPFSNWNAPYDEACEEASLLMVGAFNAKLTLSKKIADSEIVKIVKTVTDMGYGVDIGVQQAARVARQYYGSGTIIYHNKSVTVKNMKAILASGHPIIIPVQGQLLKNSNFKNGGPPYHMLVVKGYDDKYFYTNDPGTRNGNSYKYKQDLLLDAIHDWTGDKKTVEKGGKAILVLL